MTTNLQQTLLNPGYRNWVKAGLALKCTKDGLQDFVGDEIQRFQQNVLNDICNKKSLSLGTICTCCTTPNILPCPTRSTCSISRGRCNYHNISDPSMQYRLCPNGICDEISVKIIKGHRFKSPSWTNTDALQWCSNSWELAKCYLPKEGFRNITSSADTDFTGLISIIINHNDFQNVLTENLSLHNNMFCQARTIRNQILHTSTFQLSDAELHAYIDTLIRVLSDPKQLAADKHAKDAITKLKQIKTGTLVVTGDDEAKLREEALRAITEKKQEVIEAIHNEGNEQMTLMEKKKQNVLEDIQKEGSQQAETMEEKKQDIIAAIHREGNEQTTLMEKKKQDILTDIQKESSQQAETMEEKKQDVIKAIQEHTENIVEIKNKAVEAIRKEQDDKYQANREKDSQKYIDEKQNLQRDLIYLYQTYRLKTPISPLMPEDAADITDVYVAPSMRRVEPYQKLNKQDEQGAKIKSYKDIFYKASTQCNNIYITGDAGMGKTTLCQKMTSAWCHSHSKHTLSSQMSEDEKTMLEFEFLFYISLRHAVLNSNIEEMIANQALQNRLDQELLPTLLYKERCLVILDGLDEWSPPKYHKPQPPFLNDGLPGRKISKKCTIVTTTRPWKLEVLRLKTSEMDHQIELMGLDVNSADDLIDAVVRILNNNQECSMSAEVFSQELASRNLNEFRAIPVILKQLICLWHEGKPLGNSQCTIYSGMINLLFMQAEERLADNPDMVKMKEKWALSQIQLPNCFDNKKKCHEYRQLIYSLGRLSFEALFNEKRELSLVFESEETEMYGMSKNEIDVCLKVGILSQSKVTRGYTSRMKSLSFLHKTFQEYLAAMFISTEPLDEVVGNIFRICSSVNQVIEMSKVFVFVSGMNAAAASKLSEHIRNVVAHDSNTAEYRQHVEYRHLGKIGKAGKIQSLLQDFSVDCAQEALDNQNKNIPLQLEDIFITANTAEYLTNLEHLIQTNIENIKSVYIDTPPVENVLEILMKMDKLLKLAITGKANISIHNIYTLVCKSKNTLLSLVLSPSNSSQFNKIMNIPSRPEDKLSAMLHMATNLQAVRLENTVLPHPHLDCLMSLLSQTTRMKEIAISNCQCSDCGHLCHYQLDFSHHQQLQCLILLNLYADKVEVDTSHLNICHIGILHKYGVITSVVKCLQGAPKLKQLAMSGLMYYGFPADALDPLVELLPTLIHLECLKINDIDFGEREVKLSPKMKNLETVVLSWVTMTSKAVCEFAGSIPHTQRPVSVELHMITITPTADVAIGYVRSCPRFVMTRDADVTKDGASVSLYFQTA